MGALQNGIVTIVGGAALTVSLVFGLSAPPAAAAGAGETRSIPTPAQIAQRRYEQARPRTAVPFDPSRFDEYVGYYELSPNAFFHITRNGSHYFAQLTGQPEVEIYPESATGFFSMIVPAQISFEVDAQGRVTGLVLHQNGLLQPAKKVDRETATKAEAALDARIKADEPSPGTEAAVRQYIAAAEEGQSDEDAMAPNLAALDRMQRPFIRRIFGKVGPYESLKFKRVDERGLDVYVASFAHGKLEVSIAPLSPDGKITTLALHPAA